jgi:sec-independent protein translocase protein TatB
MLVSVRNWVQRSPDAAMVLRARQEIEDELAQLRANLMEVQNVRNEVLEAAKQINQTVKEEVIDDVKTSIGDVKSSIGDLKADLDDVKSSVDEVKGAPGTVGRTRSGAPVTVPETPAGPAPETPVDAAGADTPGDTAPLVDAPQSNGDWRQTIADSNATRELDLVSAEADQEERSIGMPCEPVPVSGEPVVNGSAASAPSQRDALAADVAELRNQIEELAYELFTLRKALYQRGLMDDRRPSEPQEQDSPTPVEVEEKA